MKTFTNYAEKKAKQFFNLLQGYTKGIRITAILLLLLMGVSNAWAASEGSSWYDWASSENVYFDNTNSSYTNVSMLIGRQWNYGSDGVGSSGVNFTKVANTNNLYHAATTWNHYNTLLFMDATGWGWEGNKVTQRYTYADNYTNTNNVNINGTELFYAASSTKGATLNHQDLSGYEALNFQQTIQSAVNGAVANSKATISITSYKMTAHKTTTEQTATLGTGANVSYITAARTAITTLTVGTVATGYQFDGWYTAATGGTQLEEDETYTYYPTAATTVYARFSEKKYTVTVKNDGHGTTTPSGAQSNVGQVTGLSIKATPAANYEFVNWTITSGSGSFGSTTSASTTFKPTSAATIQANFRSTATYSLTVQAGTGIASVTGSTDPVTLGNSYPITATPETGYSFSTWTASPAANATFASATNANTNVTVKNGSVTVTASATEKMSTLTTANHYDNGNPGYAAPTASVASIGYVTTADVTATAAGEGYTFEGWTLANCTRTDGGADDATSITVRSNGDGAAATVTANYKEKTKVRLYYSNTNNWSKINAYLWKDGSGSDNNGWPGVEITSNVVEVNCNTYYYYEYYKEDHPDWNRVIFNNGTDQTSDITFSNTDNNGQYYINNKWVASPDAKWVLKGSMSNDNWATAYPLTCTSATSGSVDLTLAANTKYEFKFVDNENNTWYGVTTATQITYTNKGTAQTMNNTGGGSANQTILTAGAGTYTFTWDITNKKVTVTYPTSYTVTYSRVPTTAASAPTTSPSVESGKYVAAGTSVTFTAKDANNGYTWKGWYDNNAGTGTALSANKEYEKSITANTTIYAVYTENTYQVAIVADPAEAAATLTSSPQTVGIEAVDISTTAKFTYKFDNWTATDGITIANANSESTTITATKAGTVTAHFTELQPTTVYLKPNDNWKTNNARFAIHYWADGQPAGWVDMDEIGCNRDYFVGTIPAGYTEFLFARMNPATSENNFNDGVKWNQTGNLTIPADGKNLFTLPSSGDYEWNGATTTWSTYSTPSYEITLSPRIGGTITTDPASPVEVNTEVTVTMTPSTGYAFRSGSIKIGTNEAIDITQTSSTHTICGPTEITAEFVTASEQIVYLKPTSQWKGDKPTFAVHVWNNGGDATARDIPMTAIDCNGDYYTATIPAGFHSMVFYRKSTDGTTVWNQTADLDIPVNTTNNCYTITSTGSKEPFSAAGGNWGTYTEPKYAVTINAPESGTIKVTIGGVTTTVTSEAKTISNVALNAQMDVLFEPATGYELGKAIIQIGNNAEANAAGTYEICGPTEITAYFVTKKDQVVYLRPTDAWLADNARFAIWAFNRYAGTEASQWIELTTQETDYTGAFSGTIPAGHSHIQFVRMPSTGEFSFDIDLAQTLNYSIPTDGTNNRFVLGATVTTSGEDYGKYQGSWEANNTPIYGIPGDWQGNDAWAAADYPLMGPNGQTTVHITQTNDTLGFKVYHYPYGTTAEQWLGNSNTMVRGNSTDWTMTTTGNNCGLGVDIAGDYVFNFDIRTKQLTVTYPDLPAPNAITASAQRVFEESVLTWFAGDGTEANPYQLYIDETARFTVTPLTEVAGLTAYYRFGHYEEQTTNSFDFTEINTKDTTLTVIAYYKNAMGSTSDTVTTQTPYIKGLTLPFYLMTDPSGEINIDRVAAGENILVQFRSDAAATVGLYVKKNDEATETKITDITSSISYDYTYDVDNNIDPCILHFIAKSTQTVHGRTFEATANVAIYKNVIIKVNDPEGWVKNAYMWRDGSGDVLTPWPGDPVLQHFGTWRVFSVKYPYYDRFIVNAGTEGAQQTVNWILPSDDTCYELLGPENNGSNLPEDAGKYGLKVANCPGNLLVGDLQDTTIYVSDQIVVIPSIALGLGYSTSDLTPSVTSSNTTAVTATMSGMNITIIGNAEGESTITVTYTLVTGETATKTFKVTVEKNTNITIQVQVPINFGDGDSYQWVNNDGIYIRYWGTNIDGTNLNMTYLYTDDTHKYAQAQIPLGTDGKINFHFYYESYGDDNQKWRQTTNIENVTTSGCYLLKQHESYYRGYQHNGQNCANSYQIKILMANGKTYTSNTVSDASETLSFFAPGKNETGYKAGAVMLYYNNKMVATIDPAKFETSGVYTANLHDTKNDITNVAPYTGDYYIRTWGTDGDLNNQGWESAQSWTDEQKAERKFTYFVSREGEFYNHYWVQDMNSGNYDGKDVSACVANDYNDDLAGKLLQDKHTDEYGDIKIGTGVTINVRFGYDPRTNYFGRAVLKGSEYDNYLNIHCDNAYADKDCTRQLPYGTSNTENKMHDISNWVYQRDFYVPITNQIPSASVYLEAISPNNTKSVTDHLLGYVTNEITGEATTTPIQRRVIGSGTTNGVYLMRIVYDFKTNRIITAWLPQGTVEIDQEKTINSDVLFVREENNEVPQIQLSSTGKIKSLESMFFAMELQRGDADRNNRHQEQYWFTLPFDCVVGSISGVPGYMQIWGIQRYNGKKRAENGWFNPSTTFWEWLTPDDVMHAGEGYLLVFDKKNAPFEEIEVDKMDAEGNLIEGEKETISMMRLYFPSIKSGFDMQQQSEEQLKRTYENHTCTITTANRDLQDSNWKVIGTTSYNNAGISGYTKDSDPEYEELSDAPSFRYQYEYRMSDDNKTFWYKYTPENGQTATYKSFYGYMVQFAGTINWQPIMSETVPEQIAARRYVPANERTSYTTRLELANAAGEVQDLTFVALDEKATIGFDQNKDLNKVQNRGTNIYTFVEGLPFAGNTLPMEKATVPVGVRIATAGEYTFRMPDGTDGIAVTLVDNVTGTHTNMLMNEYTVTLNAGTIENRFYLVVDPDRTATSVENVGSGANGDEAKGVEKFLIDGKLFIRTTDGIFDAKGQRL